MPQRLQVAHSFSRHKSRCHLVGLPFACGLEQAFLISTWTCLYNELHITKATSASNIAAGTVLTGLAFWRQTREGETPNPSATKMVFKTGRQRLQRTYSQSFQVSAKFISDKNRFLRRQPDSVCGELIL